ncbi:FBP domain-containing protein [Herbiconiux sp. KACC 21604]|uniref:FBP domain-containing protein n=1 Tax=unclassified Herbiconiux TaxID=2618217 RepID=UPI001490D249|nr:FBP domain-containing protein [Herbiconiux sp. SALV-R1]QJU54090.1 FBP domain-containing protein [Herbiconiux sp. SALV-R1]WPO85136.1 FBP domain-containing protein [Herbiconiux sp. KACC 21604]
MQPLTEAEIRGSFTNISEHELERMVLPGLHEIVWEDREFLGWRDPHAIHRGYIVFWRDGEPVGILLKAAGSRSRPGIAAMCTFCRTPLPGGQVTLFSAPRAGQAGFDGSTVGTYICSDLGCSNLIRIVPPKSELQPDPDAVIALRAHGLSTRLNSFTENVLRAS